MVEAANIMFDDSKNDLRSLPKSVRLQILIVLSFVWSTVFSLYVFSVSSFIFGWAGVVMAHIGLILAVYLTFKFFRGGLYNRGGGSEAKNQISYAQYTCQTECDCTKFYIVFFILNRCNCGTLPTAELTHHCPFGATSFERLSGSES